MREYGRVLEMVLLLVVRPWMKDERCCCRSRGVSLPARTSHSVTCVLCLLKCNGILKSLTTPKKNLEHKARGKKAWANHSRVSISFFGTQRVDQSAQPLIYPHHHPHSSLPLPVSRPSSMILQTQKICHHQLVLISSVQHWDYCEKRTRCERV